MTKGDLDMYNYLKQRLKHAIRFRHKRGFGVHSPFVFDLITNVLKEKAEYYDFQRVEARDKIWEKDRKLCREVLTRLSLLCRDACVLREGGTALLGGAPQEADKLGDLPKKRLMALCQVPEDYLQKLDRNANMALLVTCLCVSLRQAAGR